MIDFALEKLNKKTIVFLMIFFAIMLFALFADKLPYNSGDEITNETLISYFEKLNDNYTLNVSINKNDMEEKHVYYTDSKLELYEDNDGNGFIKYKDKYYKVNEEDFSLSKTDGFDFTDKYTNVLLIKSLIPYCDFRVINKANIECNINVSDYISEYNKIYGSEIPSIDEKMLIHINHLDKYLNYVQIDYTNINKLIDNKDEKLIYKITFDDIGTNDFSDLMELYKDTLK